VNQIFISYAQEDRERARALAQVLQSLGYSVWWDIKIPPGKTFSQVIEDALKQTRCVIVLWSRHSVHSEWIEIEAAKAKQRGVLVPALLEDVASDIPLEFSRLHAANLTAWRPEVPSQEWDVFLQAIRDHVGAEPERPGPVIDPPLPPAPPRNEPETSSSRRAAHTSLMWVPVAYGVALLVEFLMAQYFFQLREIGNAYSLYSRTLNGGMVLMALVWLGVVALGVIAGRRATRFSINGARALGWGCASLGFLVFIYALAIDSERYSDGPSFPFPYYAVLKNGYVYHALLLVPVIVATVLVWRGRRSTIAR
jgi:hypothetical protein